MLLYDEIKVMQDDHISLSTEHTLVKQYELLPVA